MSRQSDICRVADGSIAILLRSESLAPMPTRMLAPLIRFGARRLAFRRLMPGIPIGDGLHHLMPQQGATLPTTVPGARIGNAAASRAEIERAPDLLHPGL